MEHLPSASPAEVSESPKERPGDPKAGVLLNGGFINAVADHIRQRVVSFSRPATPSANHILAKQLPTIAHSTPNTHSSTLVSSTKSLLSSRISEAITATISTSSAYQQRGPWDIANSPENQALQTAFIKYCTVAVLSLPELSSDSPCTHAHIALACFTPIQKLRALLLGSNKKTLRIGDVYLSPLEPIIELEPTSTHVLDPGEGMKGVILSSVSKQLQKDLSMVSQLIEHFIFPARLIESFNVAIRLINRSQFLQYLLARWCLIMHEGKPESTVTNQIGGRRSKPKPKNRNAEIVFLEWYLASSPPMVSAMLSVLKGGDCPARERLLIDLHGNALLKRDEPMEQVLSRELGILATVRRDISAAIDVLFWQYVDTIRAPIGREKPQKRYEFESDGMKRERTRSGHTRDDRRLRVEVGVRSYMWAALSAGAMDVVDDDDD